MELINDTEADTVKSIPNVIGSAVKATRCIKCDKVFFANYPRTTPNDYECHRCREVDIRDFGISSKHS